MTRERVEASLGAAYESLPEDAARGHEVYRGKVRDVYAVDGDRLLLGRGGRGGRLRRRRRRDRRPAGTE